MKTKVLIGLLLGVALCVALVWGQSATPESTSQQKAAACPACPASTVATKGTGCCASQAQTAGLSAAATAQLASMDGKTSACCAAQGQATAAAKLTKATPVCPLKAAGIELSKAQQTKVKAILAQARKDLFAVLTAEQRTKAANIPVMALVFGQTAGAAFGQTVGVAASATCPAGCATPCCAGTGTSTTAMTAEQTTCPVRTGSPIKKTVFTVYQGKKVYFCCPGCEKAFNKSPEQYVKNLPQFN